MFTLWVVVLGLLGMTAGIKPRRSRLSHYELNRREALGDPAAVAALRREKLRPVVVSLRTIISSLLLVFLALLGQVVFGWLLNLVIVSCLVLFYYRLRLLTTVLRKYAQRLYDRYEDQTLTFIEKQARILRLLLPVVSFSARLIKPGSREEVAAIVAKSEGILPPHEIRLLNNALEFDKKLARDVMTPRSDISAVARNELLGPLVLSDLHQTGHSRFPVMDGDLDHIVGILHVQDMLTLGDKRSVIAEKAMEPRVFYVREDQTLHQALEVMIRTQCQLVVVINQAQETVGVISLRDSIEALLGRQLAGGFSADDDKRAVACRG